MILSLASKIFGSANLRALKRLEKYIAPINNLEPQMEKMSDDELRAQTDKLRELLKKGATEDDILVEAFATVREASKRTLGQRHFDVQLLGGVALHKGQIAEMRTGEGKTLVSTLPTYLNALSGKGVHVVTVNDYLASRDSAWMGKIHEFLGLSVGCIISGLSDAERKQAYAADITYGTNNEFGFDYLRDNMKFSLEQMVQRPFNYAIIDEVDSILIDEARTPLIISGPSEDSTQLYGQVDKIIPKLVDADYEKDEKQKSITLTETGVDHAEELLKDAGILESGGLYDIENISLLHHTNQALRANKMYTADKDYIVKDGKVVLIDEFTGRMMDGRRMSEGLHQALEAKEGVAVQNENQTLASITFQNYFRLYPKLSGMTGTGMTEAEEFWEIYKLSVVDIPTHKPIARVDNDDKIYKSLDDKSNAIIELVSDCYQRGQPILVGTISIEKSEFLSSALKKAKIPHNVLNARYHEQEAQIISQAGKSSAVTIATNMAGRGTDIQLGGNLDMRIDAEVDKNLPDAEKQKLIDKIEIEVQEDKEKALSAGGLYVIGTERHESRRIDNQLRGRSGRQGDPGTTIFFLSVEDDLVRVFAGDKLESLLANSHIGLKDGESLEHPLISKMLERAQGKVESMNFEIRKNLLKFDDVMNDQRKVIYDHRKEIMNCEDAREIVQDMRYDIIDGICEAAIPQGSYPEKWDDESLELEASRLLSINVPAKKWFAEEGITKDLVVERVVKLSDDHMAAKAAATGTELWRRVEKSLLLQILDSAWKDHLLSLDHMRQGINLRAYGQKDPLNEYKTEAFGMFEGMLNVLRENVTQTLSIVEVNADAENAFAKQKQSQTQMHEGRSDPALSKENQTLPHALQEKQPFDASNPESWGKTKRNAPCPCGSGKKYKHCHGKI